MTVFASIAEFERDLIRERTAAGRMAAKSKGVRFGRPRKLNPQQVKLAKRLLNEGKLVSEIAETFGGHVATIYRLGAALWSGHTGLAYVIVPILESGQGRGKRSHTREA